ncbi:glycosyltransferase family 2 protein [Paracidovorax wautersii]|uniref:Glycosyltransferase involved in cell wall bisynthesis n=1 Tax=Paracidovorax wautersii TaxID=1177982 RepID=A0A1I2C2I9_9BURK|nr:glycosyltransferase family 2 protein [Paracidovorax wautersii]SFE62656.1 Glycosyltransferase involved in cell wall bisynthesis [Paracidovorax wautersii]
MTPTDTHLPPVRIAAMLPCYNEALAIRQVIEEFKTCLPEARIYVFDNNSTDDTVAIARACGAEVIAVRSQGKGNVVRRMFADIDADVYVMVDGDATYDLRDLRQHIGQLLAERLDMVVGCRRDDGSNPQTYRPGHRLGNRLLTGSVHGIFGQGYTDMLSGYRVFSRRYAKSFPAMARGFETETELTVHALVLRMPYAEVDIHYRARPEGSVSKLSTLRDGWRILGTIAKLFASEKPLMFFSLIAAVLAAASLGLAIPLLTTYLHTGLVPRLPTGVAATGIMLCAALSLVCGIVMHSVTLGRREAKLLAYLAVPVWQGPAA